jgi:hypothetical protein
MLAAQMHLPIPHLKMSPVFFPNSRFLQSLQGIRIVGEGVVGAGVGRDVGCGVGNCVGDGVGDRVGGNGVGDRVVGDGVGDRVGNGVGDRVVNDGVSDGTTNASSPLLTNVYLEEHSPGALLPQHHLAL